MTIHVNGNLIVFFGGAPLKMAERSFAKEVELLKLGHDQEFHGENILAVTKALLESGISYVGGYQGAPVSHLMDVFADASGLLEELGVRFESSASEATAAAMLAASINYPMRGAVTWKSTVGTNVASDALANLASAGVKGGALIVVGEDYGEGASIMQERTHAFAMKSQIWLLDPRPEQQCLVDMVRHGFDLSEASSTPVMLMMRIRACHMHGVHRTQNNVKGAFLSQDAHRAPSRSADNIILPPATFAHERKKIATRWPKAVDYIREHGLNDQFQGTRKDIGIIVQGGLFNVVSRALATLGFGDYFGNSDIPVYVLNVTYPLLNDEIEQFCAGKRALLVVEEGQPEYIEQAVSHILRQAGISAEIRGKGDLPMAGEYTADVVQQGLAKFIAHCDKTDSAVETFIPIKELELSEPLPLRPSGLCTGCPERPLFASMKLVQKRLGQHHVSADIGCHSFATLPPFNMGSSIMGYGLGAASSAAFPAADVDGAPKRAISMMGDGGFWHNGLTSGIGNAAFNKTDGVTIIVDNGYAAATGGQDIPSSRGESKTLGIRQSIESAVRGVGVSWVKRISTYDMNETMSVLEDALTTDYDGPKVIVAEGECQLNRQRRIRPLRKVDLAEGRRVEAEQFGVDEETCTGDHSCIRLSGCPSLTIKPSQDPLRAKPVAHVDANCVGCGVCGSVAQAAVLCPSFYKVTRIHNPTKWERFAASVNRWVMDRLLARRVQA